MNSSRVLVEQQPATGVKKELSILMEKLAKTEKKSVLVDNRYLDSVEEAKMKKQKEILKRQTKSDPRKSKITRMVQEFFKLEEE